MHLLGECLLITSIACASALRIWTVISLFSEEHLSIIISKNRSWSSWLFCALEGVEAIYLQFTFSCRWLWAVTIRCRNESGENVYDGMGIFDIKGLVSYNKSTVQTKHVQCLWLFLIVTTAGNDMNYTVFGIVNNPVLVVYSPAP